MKAMGKATDAQLYTTTQFVYCSGCRKQISEKDKP